jgi:hypothetical protein
MTDQRWQEHVDAINQLMKSASPIGAYCLGMATSCALRRGGEPPGRADMQRLLKCRTVEEGEYIVAELFGPHQSGETT